MDIQQFWIFAIAVFLLNITPGNDFIFVATRSISYGKKAGIISGLGISLGTLVHVFASIFGLSVILSESALAFNIIKYIGATYLIYLGIRSILAKSHLLSKKLNGNPPSSFKLLRQGFVTNVFNPKVALFFLSFLPQFVNPANGNVTSQLLILGLWFIFSGTIVNITISLLFSVVKNWLARFPLFWNLQNKITGTILIALGLKIALTDRK
jgi:threonine/homoserine/homoserine lactone efflux protein